VGLATGWGAAFTAFAGEYRRVCLRSAALRAP